MDYRKKIESSDQKRLPGNEEGARSGSTESHFHKPNFRTDFADLGFVFRHEDLASKQILSSGTIGYRGITINDPPYS